MDKSDERFYESASKGVLSNDLLTKWLTDIEERLRRIEASLSTNVTWGVSQDELAETESKHGEE
jgi:hypothetical protein